MLGRSIYGEDHDITINSSNIGCTGALSCCMRKMKEYPYIWFRVVAGMESLLQEWRGFTPRHGLLERHLQIVSSGYKVLTTSNSDWWPYCFYHCGDLSDRRLWRSQKLNLACSGLHYVPTFMLVDNSAQYNPNLSLSSSTSLDVNVHSYREFSFSVAFPTVHERVGLKRPADFIYFFYSCTKG